MNVYISDGIAYYPKYHRYCRGYSLCPGCAVVRRFYNMSLDEWVEYVTRVLERGL